MKLSLKLKLSLLSLMALTLVGTVIAVGAFFNQRIEAAHGLQLTTTEVGEAVGQARVAGKAYLQFYEHSYQQKVASNFDQARQKLDHLDQSAAVDTSSLRQAVEDFQGHFNRVVDLHNQNAELDRKLQDDMGKVKKNLAAIEDSIRGREFDLQMEGEELSVNETNLLTLLRDTQNLTLTLQSTRQNFLLNNDAAIIVEFKAYFRKTGMGFIAGLQQFSQATGESEYITPARKVRSLVEQSVASLDRTQELFANEHETVLQLDTVSERLLANVQQLLARGGDLKKAARSQAITIICITAVSGALIFLVLSWLVMRSIIRPLNKGIELAETVQKGDLSQRMEVKSHDEIGRLGTALNQMADSLEEKAEFASRIAKGDLSHDVNLNSEKDVLGGALKTMLENLNGIFGTIHQASEQVAYGSSKVAESSQSLSQGSTESASSLEEIAATMNELESQTRTNAGNAGEANQLTSAAQGAAVKGNQHMQEMVTSMTEIAGAGQNISKIIKVIDEIAFQTNLLALNAAVEAARAGQHGKGFAVVAEEVRNLAGRSAKAAKETAELIESSVELTEKGSTIASQTADALHEIVEGVDKVTNLVAEIATASNEQAEGIGQVNQGLTQIDQVTQQNTANAEESAAASEELSAQANQLLQTLSRFQLRHSPGSAPGGGFSPAPVDSGGSWQGVSFQSPDSDELIAWSPQLATGIDSIDRQHKQLVHMINELFVTMRDGGNTTEIGKVLNELIDYTKTHFGYEEGLMQKHGYPQIDAHRQLHVDFFNQVAEFKQRFDSGQRLMPGEIFNFLKSWLLYHIKAEDRDGYAEMLRSKGAT